MNNGKACGLFPSSLQWGPRHSGMSMYACSVVPIDLSALIASLASVESHGRGHKPPVSCAQSTISDVWQMGGEQMEVGDTITVAHKSMLCLESLPRFAATPRRCGSSCVG